MDDISRGSEAMPGEGREPVAEICAIVERLTGVQLGASQRQMVLSRMARRLAALHLPSLPAYLTYFHAHTASESPHLVALLTTHHSYFFREFGQFNLLRQAVLPELVARAQRRPDRTLRFWSAACSRGQEVYSLAMFLDLHVRALDPNLKWTVLGTDIDRASVEIARNGVYPFDDLKTVPLPMLERHWARGSGEIAAYAKARKSLRDHVDFRVDNVLTPSAAAAGPEAFDVIFCRNVFIYFNDDQIRTAVAHLCRRAAPGGYLFVGISESLGQLKLPLRSIGPSAYQIPPPEAAAGSKRAEAGASARAPAPTAAAASTAHVATARPLLRVLCVDDSPSILLLLRKILSAAEGFEVVGEAHNGVEAAQKVAELEPDLMTLDIHMPEMTGIEYLQRHLRPNHPPVVMVTSVSRENADLAGQALTLGACDYVEKPALNNLAERAEELCTKLRCASLARAADRPRDLSVDRAFARQSLPSDTTRGMRLVVCPLSQHARLRPLFAELVGPQPPCLLVIDGARDALVPVAAYLTRELGRPFVLVDKLPPELAPGTAYIIDAGTGLEALVMQEGCRRLVSVLVYGEVSAAVARRLLTLPRRQLLLEDLGLGRATRHLEAHAADIVLPTSFAYLSAEYLQAK